MKRTLFTLAVIFCAAVSVLAQQSGYGGDGKAASGASVSSFIRLYETAPGASTTALAGAGAGNVDNGAHLVKVTCYTPGGQTTGGTASNSTTVADKTTNGKIAISSIPLCSSYATGRKVYMTAAGGSSYFLLSNGTIADNSTTTLTANDSDATLIASTAMPTTNTAQDTRVTIGQNGIGAVLFLDPTSGSTGQLGLSRDSATGDSSGFRIYSANAGRFYYDAYNHIFRSAAGTTEFARISQTGLFGLGTASPSSVFHVSKNLNAAAWGTAGIVTQIAASTHTDTTSSGTVASVVFNSIGIPTISAGSSTTFTAASTFYVAGPPVASTNVTITGGYAAWVASGSTRLDGPLIMGGTPQTLTGSGAVNLTTYSTLLNTTGGGTDTLAAGSEGQYKFITMSVDAGDAVVTVTNLNGGTTITFNDVNDFVLLFYQNAKWHIIVNSGCAVA